jgi:hypothetical protein
LGRFQNDEEPVDDILDGSGEIEYVKRSGKKEIVRPPVNVQDVLKIVFLNTLAGLFFAPA